MKHERQNVFRREPAPVENIGNLCKRALTAKVIASVHRRSFVETCAELYPNDRTLAQMVTRAASNPAMTTVAGWAMELAHKVVADTLEAMGAASGAADVMKRCLTLQWDGAGAITVPAFVASAANSG